MLLKKLFRTLWQYKAQFISMVIMVALGIGVFLGFNVEWYSLEVNTKEIYDATGFADGGGRIPASSIQKRRLPSSFRKIFFYCNLYMFFGNCIWNQ